MRFAPILTAAALLLRAASHAQEEPQYTQGQQPPPEPGTTFPDPASGSHSDHFDKSKYLLAGGTVLLTPDTHPNL